MGFGLRAIGDLEGIPDFARKMVMDTVERTKNNQDWNLTLALNYGSRQEVINAVKSLVKDPTSHLGELDWKNFAKHLQTKDLPDPDLIIHALQENFD